VLQVVKVPGAQTTINADEVPVILLEWELVDVFPEIDHEICNKPV